MLFPHFFQQMMFVLRVHALPEPLMLIAHKLSSLHKTIHCFLFKYRIVIVDEIKNARLQDHVARIDGDAIIDILFTESSHAVVPVDIKHALLLLLANSGQRRDLSMLLMKLHELRDIDIADAITIRHEKRLIADIRLHAFDSAARHRLQSRIDDRHAPRFRVLIVQDDLLTLREIERDIRGVDEVVREPFLDHVLLVARADDEVMETVMRILFHDMPEDRHPADLDHGLRAVLGFLRYPRAEAAGK